MPFRFDNTSIPGLFSIDGYIDIGARSPGDVHPSFCNAWNGTINKQTGYRLVRDGRPATGSRTSTGSHHYFTKPGQPPFSIPVHDGKVKPYYVRQVEKVCQG